MWRLEFSVACQEDLLLLPLLLMLMVLLFPLLALLVLALSLRLKRVALALGGAGDQGREGCPGRVLWVRVAPSTGKVAP